MAMARTDRTPAQKLRKTGNLLVAIPIVTILVVVSHKELPAVFLWTYSGVVTVWMTMLGLNVRKAANNLPM
jgi:hypothetical protein